MKRFTDEQLGKVAETLHEVVTDVQVKLRWGSQQRDILHQALKAGEKVGGYRAIWLRDVQKAMAKVLGEHIDEFNKKYPHDRISQDDVTDATFSFYSASKKP
jgi:hypothetical protein